MKLLSIFFIAILLLQVFPEEVAANDSPQYLTQMDKVESNGAVSGQEFHRKYKPHKINCSHACSRRCSEASRKNRCQRACKACCAKCKCVPPGAYGNKGACPCYAKLRTKGNKLKCP